MRVAIRGNDQRALDLKSRLSLKDSDECLLCGKSEVKATVDLYKDKKIDTFYISAEYTNKTINQMVEELLFWGVEANDIHILSKEGERTLDEYVSYLEYMEFHITDHCNLNCAGCSHFSSLCREEKYIDFRDWKQDIKALKKVVKNIDLIRILGGEPLLHKDLVLFIRELKQIYPNSKIAVTTNGILVPKMDEILIEELKGDNVVLEITLYKPMIDRIEVLSQFLKERGVKFQVLMHGASEFHKVLVKEPRLSSEEARKKCPTNCRELYKGRMFPCPMAAFVFYYNRYYAGTYPEEKGLDIYKENISICDLKQYLNSPFELCKYCALPLEEDKDFPWEVFNGVDRWTI